MNICVVVVVILIGLFCFGLYWTSYYPGKSKKECIKTATMLFLAFLFMALIISMLYQKPLCI